MRKLFVIPKLRRKLRNKDFTLLSNNCNGGFIYHDLGLQFRSPTINLFFYNDHYFTFLEHLDEYLASDLKICDSPQHTPETEYPVFNLGGEGNLPLIELHFLHYHNGIEAARNIWDKRKARINKENLFAIFSFFEDVDEDWMKRFDAIDLKNKVAFVNRPLPQYKSAFYIKGYEKQGLGQLNEYDNLLGCKKFDQFNYIRWFNNVKATNK